MKFWKNLAICITLALSCFLFNGCNCSGRYIEVSVDLDGDGIISDWEIIFEGMQESNSSDRVGTITEISSFDELKAINDQVEEIKFYKLTRNIDCDGEAVSINLGNSVLYGNNKVIKNFQLKKIELPTDEEDDIIIDSDAEAMGLIYGGSVYDLRLFMGYQNITLENTCNTYISPFVEVNNLTNITVKGRIDVERKDNEGFRGGTVVEVSLCTTNGSGIENNDEIVKTYKSNINGVETIGRINYIEEDGAGAIVKLASVANCLYEDSFINNAKSSVDITANSGNTLIVGGIVADSYDMVSNSQYSGTITTTYLPNLYNYIGGIVARNYSNAEVKNVETTGNINFETDIVTSVNTNFHIGGVVGRNLGVVNYVENKINIDIKKANNLTLGGVCGSSEYGIFSNIINRATLNVTDCANVKFAEICAESKRGHFEQIVDLSNTVIDNKTIVSQVQAGMVTIFETSIGKTDVKYDAEYSPTFKGIFVAGSVTVNQKKVGDSSNFTYNLGLRNPYEYYEVDEAGNIIYEEVVDDTNNSDDEEDGDNILSIPKTKTRIPDVYSKLYYLKNSYSVENYLYTEESDVPQRQILSFTFAKDNESSADYVAPAAQSRPVLRFFVDDLGFKYGVNHNEIDLSGCQTVADLTNLKFSLSEEDGRVKYFEGQQYNGELAIFDRFFEDTLIFGSDNEESSLTTDQLVELNKQTEIYSYINYLMLSDHTDLFVPIRITSSFFKNNPIFDESANKEYNLGLNIRYLISLIVGVEPSLEEKSADDKVAGAQTDNTARVKYESLKVLDSKYEYSFVFDVSQITDEDVSSAIRSDYLIYLRYTKK